jgi:hypothetical protein
MIFTRYLYIKEEVESALLISLLKRDANSARFWSKELAGEELAGEELKEILLEIYFNFYFTNNFDLMIDLNDLLSTKYEYNLDIYLLRKYVEELDKDDDIDVDEEEKEEEIDPKNFPIWLKERNYKQLAKYILRDCEEIILPYILKYIGTNIKEFNSIIKMIGNQDRVKKYNRIIYLCFTMKYLLGQEEREKEEKRKKESKESISITIKEIEENEVIVPYFDVDVSQDKGWQKLPLVQRYAIDKYDYLCIFSKIRKHITREELLDRYRNHWLYYASFSLLWKERIEKYKGIISLENRSVTFAEETDIDEELLQEFYELYGLEPDEQSVLVQNKSIPILSLDKEYIAGRWSTFCKEFSGNGLVKMT